MIESDAARRMLATVWPGVTVEPLAVSENATFRVLGGPRPAVLRVHREGYQDDAAIESELAWIAALRRDTDLDLVEPITAAGRSAVLGDPVTGRRAVLFAQVDGAAIAESELHAGLLAELGAIAARLHGHAEHWRPPAGFRRFTWDLDATIGARARWGCWRAGPQVTDPVRDALEPAARRVTERLSAFGRSPDRFGLTHGDLRAANLIAHADGFTVIDFDDMGFTWHLFDFAAAVSFAETDPRLGEWAHAWLGGYRTVRPLPAAHEAVLPDLVMLRRLQLLGWLGTHPHAAAPFPGFAAGTVGLADRYLRSRLW
jgi:Ser/Thr protein kinase RdoA (MazF antagonist)